MEIEYYAFTAHVNDAYKAFTALGLIGGMSDIANPANPYSGSVAMGMIHELGVDVRLQLPDDYPMTADDRYIVSDDWTWTVSVMYDPKEVSLVHVQIVRDRIEEALLGLDPNWKKTTFEEIITSNLPK